MSTLPIDPDETPRFEVRIYDAQGDVVIRSGFAALESAEAFADECTDEIPGRRASIEDLTHTRSFEEEVQADTALTEDYPHAGPGAAADAEYD